MSKFDFDTAGYANLEELVPQKVNLNGSAKETLIADHVGALNALKALETAMGLANPHGRDYQTHSDPQAATKARLAWSQRRVWLKELEKDIRHSAEMIAGQ